MVRVSSTNSSETVIEQSIVIESDQNLDLVRLHQLHPERYPFLLESVAKSDLGSYDILMAFPQDTVSLQNMDETQAFVEQVKADFAAQVCSQYSGHLPFHGGWFAYFSYDYAGVVEPSLSLPKPNFPLAYLARIPAAIIINHQSGEIHCVAEPTYQHLLEALLEDIRHVLASNSYSVRPFSVLDESEEVEDKYLNGVERIKEYILDGDVFQVNLSRNWRVALSADTHYLDVYEALRQNNPAPFAALAHFEAVDDSDSPWQIISSSPERLVKYKTPWVETRPIAGTRKRSEDVEQDLALIDELISHPKERAEHIMLIDLERNDLGRICQPGTVEVNELMVVESYEHVHHIVSNVRGQLREGFDPLDIVHALFPGGTITGCPKVRCMEIIAELEQMPREAYTGSLGYINRDGSMDLNILIRTMIQHQQNGENIVEFRAGAGIVTDSQAPFELKEARHKAKGLIRALQSGQA